MGCPKHYAVSRGCGSALMERPIIAEDIVKTLRRNINVPISVKTRIFQMALTKWVWISLALCIAAASRCKCCYFTCSHAFRTMLLATSR
mmetsp:Transcript_19118/g.26305  ORF Transcript_19118/g.26305 Transcript_19118/m.26305 type:complete len:89 (-) Transcript_19118:3392-3658(-)